MILRYDDLVEDTITYFNPKEVCAIHDNLEGWMTVYFKSGLSLNMKLTNDNQLLYQILENMEG